MENLVFDSLSKYLEEYVESECVIEVSRKAGIFEFSVDFCEEKMKVTVEEKDSDKFLLKYSQEEKPIERLLTTKELLEEFPDVLARFKIEYDRQLNMYGEDAGEDVAASSDENLSDDDLDDDESDQPTEDESDDDYMVQKDGVDGIIMNHGEMEVQTESEDGVSFKILTRSDLAQLAMKSVTTVSDCMFLTKTGSLKLLCHYKWNTEKILNDFSSIGAEEMFHSFGLSFDDYQKKEAGQPDILSHDQLFRSYLSEHDSSTRFVWCPKRDHCDRVVKITKKSSKKKKKETSQEEPTPILEISCDCGHSYCTGCFCSPHFPASCENYNRWRSLCFEFQSDIGFRFAPFWIRGCPKCEFIMEEDFESGRFSNIMTCSKCKERWCWNCGQVFEKDQLFFHRKCEFKVRLKLFQSKNEEEEESEKKKKKRFLIAYENFYSHWKSKMDTRKQLSRKIEMLSVKEKERRCLFDQEFVRGGVSNVLNLLRKALKILENARKTLMGFHILNFDKKETEKEEEEEEVDEKKKKKLESEEEKDELDRTQQHLNKLIETLMRYIQSPLLSIIGNSGKHHLLSQNMKEVEKGLCMFHGLLRQTIDHNIPTPRCVILKNPSSYFNDRLRSKLIPVGQRISPKKRDQENLDHQLALELARSQEKKLKRGRRRMFEDLPAEMYEKEFVKKEVEAEKAKEIALENAEKNESNGFFRIPCDVFVHHVLCHFDLWDIMKMRRVCKSFGPYCTHPHFWEKKFIEVFGQENRDRIFDKLSLTRSKKWWYEQFLLQYWDLYLGMDQEIDAPALYEYQLVEIGQKLDLFRNIPTKTFDWMWKLHKTRTARIRLNSFVNDVGSWIYQLEKKLIKGGGFEGLLSFVYRKSIKFHKTFFSSFDVFSGRVLPSDENVFETFSFTRKMLFDDEEWMIFCLSGDGKLSFLRLLFSTDSMYSIMSAWFLKKVNMKESKFREACFENGGLELMVEVFFQSRSTKNFRGLSSFLQSRATKLQKEKFKNLLQVEYGKRLSTFLMDCDWYRFFAVVIEFISKMNMVPVLKNVLLVQHRDEFLQRLFQNADFTRMCSLLMSQVRVLERDVLKSLCVEECAEKFQKMVFDNCSNFRTIIRYLDEINVLDGPTIGKFFFEDDKRRKCLQDLMFPEDEKSWNFYIIINTVLINFGTQKNIISRIPEILEKLGKMIMMDCRTKFLKILFCNGVERFVSLADLVCFKHRIISSRDLGVMCLVDGREDFIKLLFGSWNDFLQMEGMLVFKRMMFGRDTLRKFCVVDHKHEFLCMLYDRSECTEKELRERFIKFVSSISQGKSIFQPTDLEEMCLVGNFGREMFASILFSQNLVKDEDGLKSPLRTMNHLRDFTLENSKLFSRTDPKKEFRQLCLVEGRKNFAKIIVQVLPDHWGYAKEMKKIIDLIGKEVVKELILVDAADEFTELLFLRFGKMRKVMVEKFKFLNGDEFYELCFVHCKMDFLKMVENILVNLHLPGFRTGGSH